METRIKTTSSSARLNIFSSEALQAIYDFSKGVRKQFLRLAENSLDIAAMEGAKKVGLIHTADAIHQSQDRIAGDLIASQRKILKALAVLGPSSPSRQELQKTTGLTRSTLAKSLSNLAEGNYVVRKKQGKRVFYSISALYLPYFENKD